MLLTSIMVAGRSGSSFTAEIGSMKMREEIAAIRVMGLDWYRGPDFPPASGSPGFGTAAHGRSRHGEPAWGGLVAWVYHGMGPGAYLTRLREAIALNTFLVGPIKAPSIALLIALIASTEGFATEGSAELVGHHVTSSVVKSIFMVIVADGLFAMFFAAIQH